MKYLFCIILFICSASVNAQIGKTYTVRLTPTGNWDTLYMNEGRTLSHYNTTDTINSGYGRRTNAVAPDRTNLLFGQSVLFKDSTIDLSLNRLYFGYQGYYPYSILQRDTFVRTNDGTKAVRVQLNRQDTLLADRSEVVNKLPMLRESWFGISMYPPSAVSNGFRPDTATANDIVMQMHGQDGRVPTCYLAAEGGHWKMYGSWIKDTAGNHYNAAFQTVLDTIVMDQWTDWAFHVKFSDWNGGDTTGFVQVYENGVLVLNYVGPIGYGKESLYPYLKFGIYKPIWGCSGCTPPVVSYPNYGFTKVSNRVMWFDEARFGTQYATLSDVMPGPNIFIGREKHESGLFLQPIDPQTVNFPRGVYQQATENPNSFGSSVSIGTDSFPIATTDKLVIGSTSNIRQYGTRKQSYNKTGIFTNSALFHWINGEDSSTSSYEITTANSGAIAIPPPLTMTGGSRSITIGAPGFQPMYRLLVSTGISNYDHYPGLGIIGTTGLTKGSFDAMGINMTINTPVSSTAGWCGYCEVIFPQQLGSGENYLMDLRTSSAGGGSGSQTHKFSVGFSKTYVADSFQLRKIPSLSQNFTAGGVFKYLGVDTAGNVVQFSHAFGTTDTLQLLFGQGPTYDSLKLAGGNFVYFPMATRSGAGVVDTATAAMLDSLKRGTYTFRGTAGTSGIKYSATTPGTALTGSTLTTNLMASTTGVGSLTIPANSLSVGTTIVLHGFLRITTGALNTDGFMGLYGFSSYSASAEGFPVNQTNTPIEISVYITILTTGSSGTASILGYYNSGGNNTLFANDQTGGGYTINTTTANTMGIGWNWNTSSSNSIQALPNFTMKVQ